MSQDVEKKGFSAWCRGTVAPEGTRKGQKGVYHDYCPGCICRCHDRVKRSKYGWLRMKGKRVSGQPMEWRVSCRRCYFEAEFIHHPAGHFASKFLHDEGWVNLYLLPGWTGGDKPSSKPAPKQRIPQGRDGTRPGGWLCPNCALEDAWSFEYGELTEGQHRPVPRR